MLLLLPNQVGPPALMLTSELHYEPMIEALERFRGEQHELASLCATELQGVPEMEAAISLVSTRAFFLELGGDAWASCHALVPMLDFFNHAEQDDSNVEWTLLEDADTAPCFAVSARRAITAGQVRISRFQGAAARYPFDHLASQ